MEISFGNQGRYDHPAEHHKLALGEVDDAGGVVDDVETEKANEDAAIDGEEDEDYINKDEAKRDLRERGLRE